MVGVGIIIKDKRIFLLKEFTVKELRRQILYWMKGYTKWDLRFFFFILKPMYAFACMLSCVWLFGTTWTVAHQAFLSVEFSRQEYCSRYFYCHFLLQGTFLTQGLNWCLLCLLHWQADSFPLCHLGSSLNLCLNYIFFKKMIVSNTGKSTEVETLCTQRWKYKLLLAYSRM